MIFQRYQRPQVLVQQIQGKGCVFGFGYGNRSIISKRKQMINSIWCRTLNFLLSIERILSNKWKQFQRHNTKSTNNFKNTSTQWYRTNNGQYNFLQKFVIPHYIKNNFSCTLMNLDLLQPTLIHATLKWNERRSFLCYDFLS